MILEYRVANCCGITEITGFNGEDSGEFTWTPPTFMRALARYRKNWNWRRNCQEDWGQAIYLMTFAYDKEPDYEEDPMYRTKEGAKQMLALSAYIKKHGLGDIRRLPDTPHPAYRGEHILRSYLWAPDNKRLKALFKRRGWLYNPTSAEKCTVNAWRDVPMSI